MLTRVQESLDEVGSGPAYRGFFDISYRNHDAMEHGLTSVVLALGHIGAPSLPSTESGASSGVIVTARRDLSGPVRSRQLHRQFLRPHVDGEVIVLARMRKEVSCLCH